MDSLELITVYITIGNSDNKLAQSVWAHFIYDVDNVLIQAQHHRFGEWHSLATTVYQNAIWCVQIKAQDVNRVKHTLSILAKLYDQEAIAWIEAKEPEFITPIKD
jgi:hypothetical protein